MSDIPLAKLQWTDPVENISREFILVEGSTATIGRSSANDIQIAEQHVSRQHAVISYRDGIFMVNDLGSSNGTFVNDNKVEEPFPLFAGDVVRLYVPIINFLAIDDENDEDDVQPELTSFDSQVLMPTDPKGQGSLIVTNGPQEGQTIPLLLESVTVGRATNKATWEVLIQDPSVSRPHARLDNTANGWTLTDLGSSNGTQINKNKVSKDETVSLKDGDIIELGSSILLFRTGWQSPHGNDSSQDISVTGNKSEMTMPKHD